MKWIWDYAMTTGLSNSPEYQLSQYLLQQKLCKAKVTNNTMGLRQIVYFPIIT